MDGHMCSAIMETIFHCSTKVRPASPLLFPARWSGPTHCQASLSTSPMQHREDRCLGVVVSSARLVSIEITLLHSVHSVWSMCIPSYYGTWAETETAAREGPEAPRIAHHQRYERDHSSPKPGDPCFSPKIAIPIIRLPLHALRNYRGYLYTTVYGSVHTM